MRFPIPRRLRPAIGACMSLAAVSAVALGVLPQQQGTVDLLTQGNVTVSGAAANDSSGYSVAAAGDLNGDGRDDVIVGAYTADPSSRSDAGSSYVIYGSSSPTDVDLASLGSRGFRIDGAAAFDISGRSVAAAGDLNGDGRDDVIVGAHGADPSSRSLAGSSYVIYGSSSPTDVDLASLGSRGFRIDGAAANNFSGSSVAAAGDLNGDGRDDVIVGADGADPSSRSDAGSSYVIYGSSSPTDLDLASLGSRGFRIDGAAANDQSGRSVAAAGDLNGDGRDDVIVGAPQADPSSRSNAGSSYVIYGFGTASVSYPGAITATVGTTIADAVPTVRRTGTAAFSVSPALPAGLSLDASTGVISGTPAQASSATSTVTMTDLTGTATTTVSVTATTTATAAATTTATAPAALAVTLVASRRTVVSGQRLRIGIRAANIGLTAAGSVSACVRLPSNMVITAAAGAVRSGRTACFRVGSVAPGSTVTKVLTVRAVSTRRAVVTITGTARASAASRVRANPVRVTITPRAARARVTG